jgi:hypothetical protein
MPTATATDKDPSHHLTLDDGTTTFGFVLVNSNGEIDERAITRTPVPRTSIKMTQGNTRYADLEFPYVTIAQDDWSGGRGSDDFDRDRSRFADSHRLISRHDNILMLGPREHYDQGYRNVNQYLPFKQGLTWQTLTGSSRYVAYKFTTTAAYTTGKFYVWIRRRGTPGTLTCELRADSAGDPGSVLKTDTATTSDITDTVSVLYKFSGAQALSNATAYWIVIYGAGTDDASDNWQVGTDAGDSNDLTKSSSAGSSWANASFDLFFRVVDGSTDSGGKFFEYKGSLYAVLNTNTGTPRLYLNGTKGIATGGSQSTTTLGDSSQSWTTDEWIDGTVSMYEGSASDTGKVFGTVSDSTGTVITFDAITNTPVADDTWFYISPPPDHKTEWTEISGHGLTGPITDIEVFGDYVYFAQGDRAAIRSMREHNSNGTLTRTYANSATSATYLKVVHDPQAGDRIWGAVNKDGHGRRAVSSSKSEAGVLYFALTMEDCEDVWTAGTNASVVIDETDYIAGAASVKITTTSAGAAEIIAYEDLGASSTLSTWAYRQIQWWAKSSVEITKGDLQLRLSAAADASTSVIDFDFPDMEAGVWQLISLPFRPDSPDYARIRSIGVEQVTDLADLVLHMDAILVSPGKEFGAHVQLPQGFGRLNGLEAYGDPEELWVFRERQAGRVNNGVFSPLPLREMKNASSRTNGRASTVHGVYLYFSFLQKLERYYRNNLDDVGPDKDEGLPDERRGAIKEMVSYPGRIFAAIEANATRYSSILDYNLRGWHEFYRSPEQGQSIDDIFIQVRPGLTHDKLFVIQGQDILWLPLPGLTLREDTDPTFYFTHEGTLESSWLHANLNEMEKFYKSLKLIALDTALNAQIIEADYRLKESSAWTPLPSSFSSFSSEVDFTSTTPPDAAARRLRYRLRLQSNGAQLSPKVKATIVEAIARVPPKYTYTINFMAQDSNKDIEQRPDSYAASETLVNKLDEWAAAATVLTMRCVYSPYDNREVLLDPASLRPTSVDMGSQEEAHVGQLTLVEI